MVELRGPNQHIGMSGAPARLSSVVPTGGGPPLERQLAAAAASAAAPAPASSSPRGPSSPSVPHRQARSMRASWSGSHGFPAAGAITTRREKPRAWEPEDQEERDRYGHGPRPKRTRWSGCVARLMRALTLTGRGGLQGRRVGGVACMGKLERYWSWPRGALQVRNDAGNALRVHHSRNAPSSLGGLSEISAVRTAHNAW